MFYNKIYFVFIVLFVGFDKGIVSCTHYYSIIQNSFTSESYVRFTYSSSLPSLQPMVAIVLAFAECHIVGAI